MGRSGGDRPPAEAIVDIEALPDAEISWMPPVLAVYRVGRLRLRRVSEGDVMKFLTPPEFGRN